MTPEQEENVKKMQKIFTPRGTSSWAMEMKNQLRLGNIKPHSWTPREVTPQVAKETARAARRPLVIDRAPEKEVPALSDGERAA